ncbi:MAG: glycoside hydrolase family 97 N-terminal domain-containing protein [bacterium]
MTMRKYELILITLFATVSLCRAQEAAVKKFTEAKESDSRMHADGKGWGLDKAKITDQTLPRVLLVGDSILSGYHKEVIATLKGKANVDVWSNPYCQSEKVNHVLAEVLQQGPYAVVHANMGLHGWPKGRLNEATLEPLTKAYIEVIRTKLPNAKVIWANTTPMLQEGPTKALNQENNPNIIWQNRVTAKVMKEMNVPVNDLYSLFVERLDLARGGRDMFHWTAPAYKMMAEVITASILQALPASAEKALALQSPGGNFRIRFELKQGTPTYSVAYRGQPLVNESRLGLELAEGTLNGLVLTGSRTRTHDDTWRPIHGERSTVRDRYNELSVDLGKLELTFRAYDEGVAFCYTIPKQPGLEKVVITKEQSEFRFPGDYPIWETYNAQGIYTQTTLSKINTGSCNYHKGCERPLVAQAAADLFIAVAEAKLVDYARMKFAPLAGATHALVSVLSGPVTAALPLTTPWRVVMAAESPGRLLENNDIVLNLNDPCALADTSWIKPGKVLRVMAMSTAASKATIDTAVRLGLQYILFDAGWYGEERDPASDASDVAVKLRKQLDLHEVIRYGEARGIGVILYVNRRALEQQLEQLLPLYRKWGIKGVKYGFVNVGSQEWTSWLHDAIRKAADHKLMVDVHDEYRPTGYCRTYPNLMTAEGVSGDESRPTNQQTLTLLFMRSLAGPADNTFLYYKAHLTEKATHAYQLAKAVCLFSPWQFLFWYDRPENIGDEPELDFFKRLPTSWDDTKVIHGQIGEYAVIARRNGTNWFIGAMNSGQDRTLDVPLTFLEPGRKYTAHIYSDDPNVQTRTHVKIERRPVEAGMVLQVPLSAKGGQAIRIEPAQGAEG